MCGLVAASGTLDSAQPFPNPSGIGSWIFIHLTQPAPRRLDLGLTACWIVYIWLLNFKIKNKCVDSEKTIYEAPYSVERYLAVGGAPRPLPLRSWRGNRDSCHPNSPDENLGKVRNASRECAWMTRDRKNEYSCHHLKGG